MKKFICMMLAVIVFATSTTTAFASFVTRPDPTNPDGSYADTVIKKPVLTVTNIASTGKPYLKWTKVDGAVEYQVYVRRANNTDTNKRLFTTKGDHMTHSSAKQNETYYYTVVAVDKYNDAADSKPVKRTCDLPRPKFTINGGKNGCPISLNWCYSEDNTGMQVWCSRDGEEYKLLYTAKGNCLRHSSARVGHTYKYRIKALGHKQSANSAYSYTKTVRYESAR